MKPLNRIVVSTTFLIFVTLPTTFAFVTPSHNSLFIQRSSFTFNDVLMASSSPDDMKIASDVEATTEKFGLEAGLFQSLSQKDGGTTAKELLTKYGFAYLATSIPLAILSFTICYVLVDNGVDVAILLSKLGIDSISGDTSEKVGTFAIAYAAHKAASPIRFPPTVLLTPVMAKLIGKDVNEEEEQ